MFRYGMIFNFKWVKSGLYLILPTLGLALLLTACQSGSPQQKAEQQQQPVTPTAASPAQPAAAATAGTPAEPVAPTSPAAPPKSPKAPGFAAIRIKAGDGDSFTDSAGNVWQTDSGFDGGQTVARPDIEIANTKDPQIYRSERYLMDSFSWRVPNGNYLVKLHFAETFEGITAPGERVFSFNVQGHEYSDFDVWKKAGGPLRAYVESVPVTVSNGLLKITFTPKVENPQINGIEILPAS